MKKEGTRRCLHQDTKSLITPSLHLCFFQDHNITYFAGNWMSRCCAVCFALYKWKNHFYEMKGDVGLSSHEKGREQEDAYQSIMFVLLVSSEQLPRARTTFREGAHARASSLTETTPTAKARGIQKMASFRVCREKAHGLP